MSELRERFRALDALDVPDVMSRARMIGPKAPEPHPAPRMRRIGALVFAAIVAIAAVVLVIRALDQPPQPADPTPTPPAFRQDGEVITYSDPEPREAADLLATDPKTGAVRTIVAAKALRVPFDPNGLYHETIGSAAWSADGGWVAFEIRGECIDDTTGSELPPGLWVAERGGRAAAVDDEAALQGHGRGLPRRALGVGSLRCATRGQAPIRRWRRAGPDRSDDR